jgi:ribosomal protein S6
MKKELELYELVLLLKFTSTEAETNERIQRYKDFLTERGSQVMVKNQVKRLLAYPIKGFETATSVQFVYLGNGEVIKLLNTELQRDEFILRAITTKLMDDNLSKLFA